MKWEKKGRICGYETFDLPWYKKNTMVPLPYLINDNVIRIFVTMCDESNVGRIGFVDVNAANPAEIINYSREPLIDKGEAGAYDDNGVVTASLFQHCNKLYMYYSGYELGVKVPYKIFCGVAVSSDNGCSFKKLTKASILPPTDNELFNRCAPMVLKVDDKYRMWYLGDAEQKWSVNYTGKKVPVYTMKYLDSDDFLHWPWQEGKVLMDFKNDDEHGLTLPNIWYEDNIYKMIYSIRSKSNGYRFGYAESKDATTFIRKDDQINLTISETGWDSEMVCFAQRLVWKDKVYLFYSGNHYGIGGMGYAELVEK